MGKPIEKRTPMADAFARGFDILRLGVLINAKSVGLLFKIMLLFVLLGTGVWVALFVPPHVLLGAARYGASFLLAEGMGAGHVPFEVTTSTGPELWSAQIIAADPWHRGALDTSLQTLWVGFSISMVLAIPVSLLVCLGAYRRGREATADLLARGERLLSERQLTRLVRQRATPSRIQIGTVPIPTKALNRGFVAIGSPQSGKSVVLKRMLREARRAGDLVVVFDKVGDIVGEHYDPERGDVILNPDDERSPPWSPWSEMGEAADAYRMAKALIPSVEGQNNFFHVAAQQVFSALLTRLWHLEDRSLSAMLETFLTGTREEKAELLKGTDAGMHFTGDNRSGHDVEATARVYTQSLAFLPKTSGTGQDFSIRRFIEGVITRQEATVEDAIRRLQSIYDREISAVMEAREALREGRLGAVERTIGRRSQEFPLLPKGVKMPASRQGTKRWWETHRRAVEAHWKAQDPAIIAGREAIAEETRSAFPRQKRRGAPGLFISTSSRQLHAVRPLISLWLDTVADTILGLPANRERRIWVFLDEIQALQKLPSLLALLTEGSKYGVVVVAGVQNLAQFRMHFGKDEAETIISMLQSKAFFRMTEPDSAYWIERAIGHAITEHIAESIRYGTSTTMDGAQITPQRVNEPIVMAGDVMSQADLHCYLKMAGDWPVGAIQMKFQKSVDAPEPNAEAFARRDPRASIFTHLLELGYHPIDDGEATARALADRPSEERERGDAAAGAGRVPLASAPAKGPGPSRTSAAPTVEDLNGARWPGPEEGYAEDREGAGDAGATAAHPDQFALPLAGEAGASEIGQTDAGADPADTATDKNAAETTVSPEVEEAVPPVPAPPRGDPKGPSLDAVRLLKGRVKPGDSSDAPPPPAEGA